MKKRNYAGRGLKPSAHEGKSPFNSGYRQPIKRAMKMKFWSKVKVWWKNRAAIIRATRLRALEVGESVLTVVEDSTALADALLDKMLAVEAVYGGVLKGSEKAQKVIEILKRVDPALDIIESYLQRAITAMHNELNENGKAGWEKL